MTREREPRLSPRMQAAVNELKELVRSRYPGATFEVARSPEGDSGIDVWTSVDLDDPDEVIDVVVDRVMELLIDEGLPVHIVPVRNPRHPPDTRSPR